MRSANKVCCLCECYDRRGSRCPSAVVVGKDSEETVIAFLWVCIDCQMSKPPAKAPTGAMRDNWMARKVAVIQ